MIRAVLFWPALVLVTFAATWLLLGLTGAAAFALGVLLGSGMYPWSVGITTWSNARKIERASAANRNGGARGPVR